ncbi:MAG: hypothetical protein NPIRA04_24470 [Nitrospirales bacterium]|nr:MAG: hypothetical protein NPIRA04_24470 [Nitrospirales bacterium]
MGRSDADLGYRGISGPIVCSFELRRGPHDIHQGTYTLDKHGFRVTPETNPSGENIVFFGGSNIVGELVNDNETLPYYVSEQLDHRYHVVNLGWSGWGPHQMLRLLEAGIVTRVVKKPLRGAVFKTAIWHTQRVLGYSPWDQEGPKYERDVDGHVVYSGPFKTARRLRIEKYMKQSYLIQWIFHRVQTITADDVELYIDVIVRSSNLLQEQYGVPLTILFLPSPDSPEHYGGYTDELIIQRLREADLTVLEGSDVINDYFSSEMSIEGDGHPSPAAYFLESQLVASFFQQQVK